MCAVRMEKVEETLRLAIAFAERFNKRDAALVGELLHPNCVFEAAAPAPAQPAARAAGTAAAQERLGAIPPALWQYSPGPHPKSRTAIPGFSEAASSIQATERSIVSGRRLAASVFGSRWAARSCRET